jgi:hypothetical protein
MMIGARFLIMTLLVFAAGFWARVFRASLAVYFAAGLVTLALEMIVFGRWTGWGLMILPVLGACGAAGGQAPPRGRGGGRPPRPVSAG